MPSDERNWNYFTYVSDDADTYNIRADVEWAAMAAHGLAAATAGAPRLIPSKQQRPRNVRYNNTATGRSRTGPIGTAAAYAALALGDTEDFAVKGLATDVTFTATKKNAERIPVIGLSGPGLTEHAQAYIGVVMAYTATLSGGGEVDLTGVAETPEWMLAHVITAGPLVRTPFDLSPDLVTKVGWLQFGDYADIGEGSTVYWQDPIWINCLTWQWAMPSGQHMNTTRFRYLFSPGTEVRLQIQP